MIRAFTIFVMFLCALSATMAYKPMIFEVMVDGSGSIAQEDFRLMNSAVANMIESLYQISILHPGQLSDWVTVNYFGSRNEIRGWQFVRCGSRDETAMLKNGVLNYPHPQYGNTAIYSAIGFGLVESMRWEDELGLADGTYITNIIVITDGQDNNSPQEIKELVCEVFPNPIYNLFIIGVGPQGQVKEYEAIADLAIHITDFDDLMAALLFVRELYN